MEHNRSANVNDRLHNTYSDNKWRVSRADMDRLTRWQEMGTMRWDPKASWVKEKIRPMHWDPKENWNADVSVADAVHRRNLNRLEQVAHVNEFVSSPELAAAVASAVANQRRGGKSRKHKKSNRKHKKSIRRRKH
jgi:hypothetical protein